MCSKNFLYSSFCLCRMAPPGTGKRSWYGFNGGLLFSSDLKLIEFFYGTRRVTSIVCDSWIYFPFSWNIFGSSFWIGFIGMKFFSDLVVAFTWATLGFFSVLLGSPSDDRSLIWLASCPSWFSMLRIKACWFLINACYSFIISCCSRIAASVSLCLFSEADAKCVSISLRSIFFSWTVSSLWYEPLAFCLNFSSFSFIYSS